MSLLADESLEVHGPLVALLQEADALSEAMPHFGFELEADMVRAEIDETSLSLQGPPAAPQLEPSTSITFVSDAQAVGTAVRDDYRMNIFSSNPENPARLVGRATCGQAQASSSDAVTRAPKANVVDRPATVRPSSDSILWDGCGERASITIQGDFVLSLWEWDARLQDGQQTHAVRTGWQPHSELPAQPDQTEAIVGQEVEAFLFVTNGTLTLPGLNGPYQLYTGPNSTLTAAGLEIQGATGELRVDGAPQELDQSAVKVHGQSHVILAGQGVDQPLAARLTSEATGINVDGAVMAVSTAPDNGAGFPWVPWVALATGLIALGIYVHGRPTRYYDTVLAVGGVAGISEPSTRREHRGAGYWSLAARAMQRRRNYRAMMYLTMARRLFGHSLDVQVMRPIALYNLRRYETCVGAAQDAYDVVEAGKDKASMAVLVAKAYARLGDRAAALRWLKLAHGHDASTFRLDAGTSASLIPLRDDAWFQDQVSTTLTSYKLPVDPAFG
ncbi:MAG: hypothetical protein ACPHID_06425 [Thermoplasmatota archaeon]